MAITAAQIAFAGSSGRADREGEEYIVRYKVTTNDANDQAETIVEHFRRNGNLPFIGTPYVGIAGNDNNAFAVCREINVPVRPEGSDVYWYPELLFRTPSAEEQKDPNPLNWLDDLEISWVKYTVPVEVATYIKGFAGRTEAVYRRPKGSLGPVINSAGDQLDPPLEDTPSYQVLRITKYRLQYPERDALTHTNAINNDIFVIKKPRHNYQKVVQKYQAYLNVINGRFSTRHVDKREINYWSNTYELWIKADGWRVPVYDRGDRARREAGDPDGKGGSMSAGSVAVDGRKRNDIIRDRDGMPVGIVLLDGNGEPLEPGADPVEILWGVKDELPFEPLRI